MTAALQQIFAQSHAYFCPSVVDFYCMYSKACPWKKNAWHITGTFLGFFFFEIVNVEFNFSVIKTKKKKTAADLSPCVVILT